MEIKDGAVVLMEVKFFGLRFTSIFPHKTSAAVFGGYWKTECLEDWLRYKRGFISNALLSANLGENWTFAVKGSISPGGI